MLEPVFWSLYRDVGQEEDFWFGDSKHCPFCASTRPGHHLPREDVLEMVIKQCMGEGDKCQGRWRHVLTQSHQHGAAVRPTAQSWGPRNSTTLVVKLIYSTHLLKAGDTVPSSETIRLTRHSPVHSMNISFRSLKSPLVPVIAHLSMPGCSRGMKSLDRS